MTAIAITTITKAKIKSSTKKKVNDIRILLQNTSSFTDDEIWEALKHVTRGIKWRYYIAVNVRVTKCHNGTFSGACYWNGCSYHKEDPWSPLIIARINDNEKYFLRKVYGSKTGGGYLDYLLLSRMEALISVLAHEFRHLWQAEHDEWEKRRRGYVWGARGIFSDRDADAYAIRKVRAFRKVVNKEVY